MTQEERINKIEFEFEEFWVDGEKRETEPPVMLTQPRMVKGVRELMKIEALEKIIMLPLIMS